MVPLKLLSTVPFLPGALPTPPSTSFEPFVIGIPEPCSLAEALLGFLCSIEKENFGLCQGRDEES